MKPQYPTSLRSHQSSDEPFIYSTWLKSYRQSLFAKPMSNDIFFTYHKSIIKRILEDEHTVVTMITDVNDHDQIFGYVVAQTFNSNTIVHFVYTKYAFRKLSIMSGTLASLGYLQQPINFISHLPRDYYTYKSKYNLEYNPYLLGEL